jgi:methylthioribose-1-phosphate isomerase
MEVNGKHYRTIWVENKNPDIIHIIDQTKLPYEFVIKQIKNYKEMLTAIKDMEVRGAGLIGAAGAYGMYLATLEAPSGKGFNEFIQNAATQLKKSRPTAINLEWAVDIVYNAIKDVSSEHEKKDIALKTANQIADDDAEIGRQIGQNGLPLFEKISVEKNGEIINILTHCNAGWLAFVDYGSALSPVYAAHKKGLKVHVWVDETRPRNQGAFLTAWELAKAGVPHTVITDNEGGLLMQKKMVDMVIVGSDRTTYTGDVANKIGTYLKALAAKDNNIPFYAAVYSSSFDWEISDGVKDIPIENRSDDEVRFISGIDNHGKISKVAIVPDESNVSNHAFDVTPARLVTAIITERGICNANKESIANLFPDKIKKNVNEGVIKFDFHCEDNKLIIPDKMFNQINPARNKLADLKLIGRYSDGLSYGNISIRLPGTDEFFISASDTGKIALTDREHYVKIISCNIEKNFCLYSGQGLPSSETLTHYIIYKMCKEANSVIHIHNKEIWQRLLGNVPTTPSSADYGTIDMVKSVENLFAEEVLQKSKLFVMHGHEEGVVCFGKSVEDAMKVIMECLK